MGLYCSDEYRDEQWILSVLETTFLLLHTGPYIINEPYFWVWKNCLKSINIVYWMWLTLSSLFAVGKRHPCRFMCIWTLLIFSLLCTLGSCDMEISSTVSKGGVYCCYLHTQTGFFFLFSKILSVKNVWFLNNSNLFSTYALFKGISTKLHVFTIYLQWLSKRQFSFQDSHLPLF